MNFSNTNRGQVWPNERKEKDTHPDFKGSLNVKGEEFVISAWKQKGGTNPKAPSLSFSVKPKDETKRQQPKDYVVRTDDESRIWD
jgi:hypothetical protein